MPLGRDLLYALDPVLWARQRLGLDLDPQQAALLAYRGHRELLNCSRQWGKSTTTAVASLHECVYGPRSRTVIVAPSLRQSALLLDSVASLAVRAGVVCEPIAGDDPGLRVVGGGEVIALPAAESTTRGVAGVTWLIVDEAARVSDDLWHSVTAFLATTNGRIWLLSTPFGRRGFFWEEHEAGRYRVTTARAAECPRISAEFLQERRASMPAWAFDQEYCCEFVSSDGAVFKSDFVLRSVSEEIEPLCL